MKESPLFAKVFDFTKWLLQHTIKFPKSQRFVLAKRIEDAVIGLYDNLIYAVKLPGQRSDHLARADADLGENWGHLPIYPHHVSDQISVVAGHGARPYGNGKILGPNALLLHLLDCNETHDVCYLKIYTSCVLEVFMQTKLTLRLEEQLIEQAKSYAAEAGKSVSQIVADYFRLLTEQKTKSSSSLTPITKSLRGLLRESKLDEKGYRKHLEEKYL